MNLKLITQKQDYESLVPKYREIEKIVDKMLGDELAEAGIKLMQMPHRIKTWESIEDKWARKAASSRSHISGEW